jgi:hypothetical protein
MTIGYTFAFAQWIREARTLSAWSPALSLANFMIQQHELLIFRARDFAALQP